MVVIDLVAQWSGPLDFQLLVDGVVPETSMTGTVELLLTEVSTGSVLETTGDVAILDAAEWKVRYTPDSADLVVGTYRARFKVTAAGVTVFFPHGQADTWKVHAI